MVCRKWSAFAAKAPWVGLASEMAGDKFAGRSHNLVIYTLSDCTVRGQNFGS